MGPDANSIGIGLCPKRKSNSRCAAQTATCGTNGKRGATAPLTANTEALRYPSAIAMPVMIQAGRDNLALTSYLQAVDAAKAVTIVPGQGTSVTMADLPNYSLNIPAPSNCPSINFVCDAP